jgi:hypothetical protein
VQSIQQHFNRFPLLGQHAVVECEECHKNAAAGDYLGLSTNCDSCHMTDFQQTTNPAHLAISRGSGPLAAQFQASNCVKCHTNFDTFFNATFDHSQTGFLLTNGHANLACDASHLNTNYNLTAGPNDCGNSGCHLTTWQQTNNPPHASSPTAFPIANCSTCHTTASWTTATFDHSTTGFLLTNGHNGLACTACHINNNYTLTIAPTSCGNSQCHLTTWQQTNNPPHQTAGASFAVTNCVSCHTTVSWTTATFDHNTQTNFPLTGLHVSTACTACHVNNDYTGDLPTTCGGTGCHLTTWQQTTSPPHQTAGPTFALANCTNCHTTAGWTTAAFDHSTTAFPLQGAHTVPPRTCTDVGCHAGGNYTTLPTTCYGCHTTDYNNTAILGFYPDNPPNHAMANFPTTCTTCHNTSTWTAATFNHNTFFSLTNAHAVPPLTCVNSLCHVGGNYTTVPTACSGCHLADYNSTATIGGTIPNHVSAQFPLDCTQCHDTIAWADAVFNHNNTPFPLTGAHMVPPRTCADVGCHSTGNYTTLPTTCYGCHTTDYNNTSTPGFYPDNPPAHAAANFPTTCVTCHNTTTWTGATFNHATFFPLTNAHAVPPLTCVNSLCHVGGNYTTVPTACSGCHLADYNSTATIGGTIPNHISAQFPLDCTQCHDTIAWADAVFNHNNTAFPLQGAHTVPPRTCADVGCHSTGNYTTLPTTCYGCHTTDYNNTSTPGFYPDNPPAHAAAGFPTTCTTCHTSMTVWTGATFNHATFFPLTNAHAVPPLTCVNSLCHVGGNYTTVPTVCSGCHLPDYNSTVALSATNPTIPNHVATQYPMDCTLCHDTINFADAVFNHNNTTFPLQGAHTSVACALCHVNGNFTTLATTCVPCHQADYNSTVTLSASNSSIPNHVALIYPTTCLSCHNMTNWLGATFSHASTGFALNGMHATIACSLCHTSTAVPPIDCYSCHSADWNSTTTLGGLVPNHTAAALISSSGFATTTTACVGCHTANAVSWTTATFTHPSAFPVNHGGAAGVCATCHTTAGDYSIFQCTVCHGNNNSANFNHPKVGGYVYNSINCYACHPRGNGG